jgi:hypothetical protein
MYGCRVVQKALEVLPEEYEVGQATHMKPTLA